jgi:hypothetical protein
MTAAYESPVRQLAQLDPVSHTAAGGAWCRRLRKRKVMEDQHSRDCLRLRARALVVWNAEQAQAIANADLVPSRSSESLRERVLCPLPDHCCE